MNNVSAQKEIRKIGKVEIYYDLFVKQENLELVHGMMERCAFLFPSWIVSLTIIAMDDAPVDDQTVEADCSPENWEYGRATIRLYAKFFDRTEKGQYDILVHELVHVVHGKLLSYTRNQIITYVKAHNEDLSACILTTYNELKEEFTETMAQMIVELMNADGK